MVIIASYRPKRQASGHPDKSSTELAIAYFYIGYAQDPESKRFPFVNGEVEMPYDFNLRLQFENFRKAGPVCKAGPVS